MYNYYEEVLQAVEEAVNDGYSPEMLEPVDLEDYAQKLNEVLWVDDSVTGNASGSFFFNAYKAEEALEEFGQTDVNAFEKGAEWVDVTIRCYLLNSCIGYYIEQNEDDLTERIERLNG